MASLGETMGAPPGVNRVDTVGVAVKEGAGAPAPEGIARVIRNITAPGTWDKELLVALTTFFLVAVILWRVAK